MPDRSANPLLHPTKGSSTRSLNWLKSKKASQSLNVGLNEQNQTVAKSDSLPVLVLRQLTRLASPGYDMWQGRRQARLIDRFAGTYASDKDFCNQSRHARNAIARLERAKLKKSGLNVGDVVDALDTLERERKQYERAEADHNSKAIESALKRLSTGQVKPARAPSTALIDKRAMLYQNTAAYMDRWRKQADYLTKPPSEQRPITLEEASSSLAFISDLGTSRLPSALKVKEQPSSSDQVPPELACGAGIAYDISRVPECLQDLQRCQQAMESTWDGSAQFASEEAPLASYSAACADYAKAFEASVDRLKECAWLLSQPASLGAFTHEDRQLLRHYGRNLAETAKFLLHPDFPEAQHYLLALQADRRTQHQNESDLLQLRTAAQDQAARIEARGVQWRRPGESQGFDATETVETTSPRQADKPERPSPRQSLLAVRRQQRHREAHATVTQTHTAPGRTSPPSLEPLVPAIGARTSEPSGERSSYAPSKPFNDEVEALLANMEANAIFLEVPATGGAPQLQRHPRAPEPAGKQEEHPPIKGGTLVRSEIASFLAELGNGNHVESVADAPGIQSDETAAPTVSTPTSPHTHMAQEMETLLSDMQNNKPPPLDAHLRKQPTQRVVRSVSVERRQDPTGDSSRQRSTSESTAEPKPSRVRRLTKRLTGLTQSAKQKTG